MGGRAAGGGKEETAGQEEGQEVKEMSQGQEPEVVHVGRAVKEDGEAQADMVIFT